MRGTKEVKYEEEEEEEEGENVVIKGSVERWNKHQISSQCCCKVVSKHGKIQYNFFSIEMDMLSTTNPN